VDEPAFTNPLLYAAIRGRRSLASTYAAAAMPAPAVAA
jgi:2-oxoglutarate dehydrogenase complex dehydrogenase (E1) component-like enzyme